MSESIITQRYARALLLQAGDSDEKAEEIHNFLKNYLNSLKLSNQEKYC